MKSMIIVVAVAIIIFGIFLSLVVVGANKKRDRTFDDEEQMEAIRRMRMKQKD